MRCNADLGIQITLLTVGDDQPVFVRCHDLTTLGNGVFGEPVFSWLGYRAVRFSNVMMRSWLVFVFVGCSCPYITILSYTVLYIVDLSVMIPSPILPEFEPPHRLFPLFF